MIRIKPHDFVDDPLRNQSPPLPGLSVPADLRTDRLVGVGLPAPTGNDVSEELDGEQPQLIEGDQNLIEPEPKALDEIHSPNPVLKTS